MYNSALVLYYSKSIKVIDFPNFLFTILLLIRLGNNSVSYALIERAIARDLGLSGTT